MWVRAEHDDLDSKQLAEITRLLLGRVARRMHAQGIEPGQRVRVDVRDGRLHVEALGKTAGEAPEPVARA
jgi:hypothetical protein